MTNPNDSAGTLPRPHPDASPEFGLTKREYMATQILAGLAANKDMTADLGNYDNPAGALSRVAIDLADHFIEALNAPKVTP